MFETLEARRLLSTVATFSDGTVATQSGSGTLTIKSGSKAASAMNATVIENGISQVNGGPGIGLGNVVVDEYNANTKQYEEAVFYNVNASKAVVIQANAKIGSFILFDGTSLHAQITGGSGNDVIGFVDRGSGGTSVDGGKGDDTIACVFSHHATVSGGDGDDTILINTSCVYDCSVDEPQAGDLIVVNGGNGDDTIIVYDGTVKVDGGKGFDSLTLQTSQSQEGATVTQVQTKNVEDIQSA